MIIYSEFHIHGDNIVECERVFDLIKQAFSPQIKLITGPNGSPVCPEFQIYLQNENTPFQFTFYPGFGRWNEDILQCIRERGGILREAPDVIITGVAKHAEEPLLAIEFCGALPAGNQAWQRSGRSYSFGLAKIPYLYVAELGGYELDAKRRRKAARMPNPAVPFSYLSYSFMEKALVLPIFVTSPGADESSRREHANEFADAELIALIRRTILNEDSEQIEELIRRKVLSLIKKRAAVAKKGQTLNPEQWESAYSSLTKGESLVDFLVRCAPLSWSKTAYIKDLTDTAKTLMQLTSKLAIGLTSTSLPMCIVPNENRNKFASSVLNLYPDLPYDFVRWLECKEDLAICWVMGFKPRGDDARPDRGLPPFSRMLIGSGKKLLTIVYGPAPTSTWPMLMSDPATLMQRNGLWEAILSTSDAVLVDTATDQVTTHGFLRSHWETTLPRATNSSVLVNTLPIRVGENDVDTVLHVLFSHFTKANVFEGMCNPPGGDWSGVSLLSPNHDMELRWLTLPRVSGGSTKRPDHVFQFFGIASRPVILSVESKETARSVEENIGPRLSSYITNLIRSPASVERKNTTQSWCHSSYYLDPTNFIFASAVAFITETDNQTRAVIDKANADIIFAYSFRSNGRFCDIWMFPTGKVGAALSNYASGINLSKTGINLRIG